MFRFNKRIILNLKPIIIKIQNFQLLILNYEKLKIDHQIIYQLNSNCLIKMIPINSKS